MKGDLHCHTKLSDGSLGIDDIIVLAEKCGVDTLAITDVDCLAGTTRAKLIGERHGIKVVQGVEISSYDNETKQETFILGYMCDSPDRLEGLCHRNLTARKRAAQFMMIKAAQSFPVTPELVLKCAQGSTNVYPVHIMAALVECGVTTELHGELYRELFELPGEKSILMRPKLPSPEEVIDEIHNSGGVAVLSNADRHEDTGLIERLLEAGLDGIEAYGPSCDEETSARLAAYAKKNGILAVGGSSFRGRFNSHCVTLGTCVTPENNLNDFLNYKSRMKRHHKSKVAAEAE